MANHDLEGMSGIDSLIGSPAIHTMQHYFFDVAALGPPGLGEIFAIGIVHFDPKAGTIKARSQYPVRVGDPLTGQVRATRYALEWLGQQSPPVRAQLDDSRGQPFACVYQSFMSFIGGPAFFGGRIVLCADDWADFAWFNFEAQRLGLDCIPRDRVIQLDTTALDMMVPKTVQPSRPLTQHVALDDAEWGALSYMAAMRELGLPKQ